MRQYSDTPEYQVYLLTLGTRHTLQTQMSLHSVGFPKTCGPIYGKLAIKAIAVVEYRAAILRLVD